MCVGRVVPIPVIFSAEQGGGQGYELESKVPETEERALMFDLMAPLHPEVCSDL